MSLWCFALLAVIPWGAVQGACPDASLLRPCTCHASEHPDEPAFRVAVPTRVTCSHVSSEDDVQRAVDGSVDYPFPAFSLLHVSFQHLNSDWLRWKRVRWLELRSSVLITFFEDGDIQPLYTVTNVTIVNSTVLRRLMWADLRPFVHLAFLHLSGVEVRGMGRAFRDNVAPELEQLVLIRGKVPSLEGGPFKGKTKLRSIEIRDARIRTLENSYFEDQKETLRWMILSGNPIEYLPDDIFEGFQVLQGVYMDGALLKTLPKLLFQRYDPIVPRFYIFSGCPFVCDCRMQWLVTAWTPRIAVEGTCHSPSTMQAKRLDQLTQKDFDACVDDR